MEKLQKLKVLIKTKNEYMKYSIIKSKGIIEKSGLKFLELRSISYF